LHAEVAAAGFEAPEGIFQQLSTADVLGLSGLRGYGTAVTERAISDGLAAGAGWSWLQSSPEGYGSYCKLGFRTVET
jgi:hypothetical protein